MREKRAIQQLSGLSDQQIDDGLAGAAWAISHSPQSGRLTNVPGILALPVDGFAGVPPLVIYYAQGFDSVVLVSLRVAEANEDDDP